MSHLSQTSLSRRDFLALTGASVAAAASLQTAGAQTPLPTGELTALALKQASDLIKSKKLTSLELTRACLARIDKYEPTLNAFITVTAEKALSQAREADAEISRGKYRGPLHGVPIALKDNIDTTGIRTTAASILFAERIPAEDAEVVRRLKNAGAVIIGKTNMLVFAGSSISTYYKPAINPWLPEYFTSGSSSGSAVAVITEMCFGALGTDTRGSVRGPAGVMSLVGLKPTYGRVSNRGVIPLAWTLDTVGPMTRTVEDAAIMLQAIAGYDPDDPSSVNMPVPDYLDGLRLPVKKLRLGLIRAPYFDDLSENFLAATNEAARVLSSLTARTQDSVIPAVMGLGETVNVESLAYHSEWYPTYKSAYPARTASSFDRISSISAVEYAKARHEIDKLRREIGRVFESVDLLITPARRSYMPKLEDVLKAQATGDPPTAVNDFNYTNPFSVFGLPAMVVPCGFSKEGFPIGTQIIGPHFGEAKVLALGHAFEQATEWHKRRPTLSDPVVPK